MVVERQQKPSTWKQKVLMTMFIKLVKSRLTSHSFQWESSLFGPVEHPCWPFEWTINQEVASLENPRAIRLDSLLWDDSLLDIAEVPLRDCDVGRKIRDIEEVASV